ncbi:MAG: hypothetical protein NC124_04505 [Clostridium sp.]|nr:hypothetical protein [Clostridium sp.]
MENRSIYYYLGVAAGFLFGILLVVFAKWLAGKLGGRVEWKVKNSYDERQLLARGRAYKYAFFTLIFYVAVVSIAKEIHGIKWFMSFAGMWIGVCLSVTVFAVICIAEDAYMSLYENAKTVVITFSLIALINFGAAVPALMGTHSLLEDGALSADCMYLVVGITFLVILAVFGGKMIYNKKHGDEEE